MNIEQFKKICKLNQNQLKRYVMRKLERNYDTIYTGDGFVYAQGDFPVLLVAHLDTVHKEKCRDIIIEKGKISSPQGIGGDDRCGVYAILKIVDKIKCHVLFCEDEETGCIGTSKFLETELASSLKDSFNYIIEIDRRGSKDAVFYDCDNDDFEKFITKEFFKTAWGSLSDISYLAPDLGCAAVNLSSGYYGAHTLSEYVVIDELDAVIRETIKLLERTTLDDKYEYIERRYTYGRYSRSYAYDYYDDYGYGYYGSLARSSSHSEWCYWYVFYKNYGGSTKQERYYARSKDEAFGKFARDYPALCYSDVIAVVEE